MLPAWNQCQNDMQFVNTNQPIYEADEAEEDQMERRDEQLHLACGKFRASRKNDRFVNESCNGQEIADPNVRQMPRQLVGGQNFVRWWFHVVSSSSNTKKKSIEGALIASNGEDVVRGSVQT